MLEAILLIFVPLGILIAGLVVLWLQSRTSTNGWAASPDGNSRVISTIAWTLVIVALFAIIGLILAQFESFELGQEFIQLFAVTE